MDIVLCTDSNLVTQTAVLINSIIYCNSENLLNFHILTLGLKKSDEKILESYKNKNVTITIYPILEKTFISLPIHMGYITKGTYLRFFIESTLPANIKKVLYLDVDTIVCENLTELWNEDIDGYAVAATKDVECDDICRYNRLNYDNIDSYFNAGVLLINLSYWREKQISKKSLNFLTEYPQKCLFHDQDALNFTLHGKVKFISHKYNVMYAFFKQNYENLLLKKEYLRSIRKDLLNPVIIHYAGKLKPWHYEYHKFTYPFGKIWQFFNQKAHNACKLIHYNQNQTKDFKYWIKQLLIYMHLIKLEKEKNLDCFIDTHETEKRILASLSKRK